MANRVTVSELVHKLVVDSTDLDKNLIASRKEITAAKRALRELRNPMEQYEKDLKDAESLLKFGTDGQELYNRAIARAEKRYKKLSGATRDEERAQERLNRDRKTATDIIEKQTTRLQRLERELHDVNRLHRQGQLSVRQHRKEMQRLNREIDEAQRGQSFFSQAGQRVGDFFGLGDLFGASGSKIAGQLVLLEAGIQLAQEFAQVIQRGAEFTIERFNEDRRTIDELAKKADAIGVNVSRLSGLNFAIGQTSGLNDQQAAKSLEEITKRASEAAQGLGESKLAFEELGISVVDLNKLTPDQKLLKIADAIQNVENKSDKFRIAGKLFGEENARIVNTLELGSIAIENMIDRADELGLSLSSADTGKIQDLNDSIDSFSRTSEGLSRLLTIETADEIRQVFEEGTDFLLLLLENKDTLLILFDVGIASNIQLIADSIDMMNRQVESLTKGLLTLSEIGGLGGLGATLFGARFQTPQEPVIPQQDPSLTGGITAPVDPAASIEAGSREAFNLTYRTEITSQLDIAKDHLDIAKNDHELNRMAFENLLEINEKLTGGNLI